MPRPGKWVVENDALQVGEARLPVGSPEWFAWLAQQGTFVYQGKHGHFTARRETRRSKPFWYAYRRRNGRLFKQYLGKTEELTAARLEQASLALAGKNLLEQYASQPTRDDPSSEDLRIASAFSPVTRVNLPVLPPHLVTRPRLIRQISTPLVLIYAPSGFGKSTLLNDWKRACDHPVAWLSLEEADNHPVRFWCSLILALQTILPGFGKETLAYLQTASPVHLDDAVTWLTNDLVRAQADQPRCSLVLDDFHRINHPEIYASLQNWLEHLPANIQLILSGHTRPPLALGHLRARGFLTELDASDLRFTLEEGIHYLLQYPRNPPLAYPDLEKLIRHSEGWAAGLTLTALALSKQEDHRQFIDTFSGAHIYLREYFLETVLQRSSPDVQDFLLKTAILKHLTGSLCDAVTGQTGGEAMLARLWQENLFIVRLAEQTVRLAEQSEDAPEEHAWYRYHDLFAEMLLSQLHARYPGEVTRLHQLAAQWYRAQNAPADAVYHLLAVNAWEEAAALMETMALRELEQYGEDSRLLRWLQELPEDVVQKHKTLLFLYLRVADMALPRQKIERFIARIEDNLSRKPASQQTQDEREVLVEIQRIRHAWAQGSIFTPPAREDSENDARWDVLNGLHLLKQGVGPGPVGLESQLIRLMQKAQAQHNLFVLLMAGGVFAGRVATGGELRRAEKISRQILEQAILQRGRLPETASITLAVLSQISLERGELAQAQQYLAQAQEVDPNPTSTNMLVQTAVLRAKIQAAQGSYSEALASIRAIRDLHARRPSGAWTDQDLLAYEALICIRAGDILAAESIIGAAESITGAAESTGENGLLLLLRAEILRAKGQPEGAEKLLAQLVRQPQLSLVFEPQLHARVQLALALFEQHKVNPALQGFTEAVRAAAPERFFRPFLEGGKHAVPLLLLALKTERLTGEAQNFIKEILRATGHADAHSAAEMEALSTSASISQREQRVLDLLSSGYSNRAIAGQLCISESTVKTHLRNIYEKLGANSRLQAVKNAKALKLVR